jgi:hypothetical protein
VEAMVGLPVNRLRAASSGVRPHMGRKSSGTPTATAAHLRRQPQRRRGHRAVVSEPVE